MMITYVEKEGPDRLPITVKLNGKTVGKIVRGPSINMRSYQYRPKGVTDPRMYGEHMESVEAVKASLERETE